MARWTVGTAGPARVEITEVGRQPLIVECRDGLLSLRREINWSWRGLLRWIGPFNRKFRVDVSVAVPPATPTNMRLIEGSVVSSGLTGDAAVNVTSGRVTLLGMAGRVHAKLGRGGGTLSVNSTSGSVALLAREVPDEQVFEERAVDEDVS